MGFSRTRTRTAGSGIAMMQCEMFVCMKGLSTSTPIYTCTTLQAGCNWHMETTLETCSMFEGWPVGLSTRTCERQIDGRKCKGCTTHHREWHAVYPDSEFSVFLTYIPSSNVRAGDTTSNGGRMMAGPGDRHGRGTDDWSIVIRCALCHSTSVRPALKLLSCCSL